MRICKGEKDSGYVGAGAPPTATRAARLSRAETSACPVSRAAFHSLHDGNPFGEGCPRSGRVLEGNKRTRSFFTDPWLSYFQPAVLFVPPLPQAATPPRLR